MAESDLAEQIHLLTDPARSFETPTPTPEDQLREAAIAGLTEASAKEVWEQTRALIMTEVIDAVSREDLLEKLGPSPEENETVLLTEDGQAAAYEAKSPIMKQFLDMTRVGSPNQEAAMGDLTANPLVTPEKFQEFCENIAQGVDYVYERYGTTVDAVSFIDEGRTHMSQTVYSPSFSLFTLKIARDDIVELRQFEENEQNIWSPKTAPHEIAPMKMAVLYGVEEAFHQHQFRTEPEKYLPHVQPMLDDKDSINPEYAENIIEKDAEVVVRAAAGEMGIFEGRMVDIEQETEAAKGTALPTDENRPQFETREYYIRDGQTVDREIVRVEHYIRDEKSVMIDDDEGYAL